MCLVRDPIGSKPLYVYSSPSEIAFATELSALSRHPNLELSLDTAALTSYLQFLYVPGPRTIYSRVEKVAPGSILTAHTPCKHPTLSSHWQLSTVAQRGLENPITGSESEIVDEFEGMLTDAIRLRMCGETPPGALLSGGIDSSTVVALAQRASARPIRTFSIAFDEAAFNEAQHAARIAAHLGTEHNEIVLTGADALALVPQLADLLDEPYADASLIPAYLICAAARDKVDMVLTGDGGDEVYGGYNRYTYGERLARRLHHIPAPMRRLAGGAIGRVSSEAWNYVYHTVAPILPHRMRYRLAGEKFSKLGELLKATTESEMYLSLVSAWPSSRQLVLGVEEQSLSAMERILAADRPERLLDRMMLADQYTYLVDDQLAKIDWVSKAVGLQVRAPLIDHRLVEFSWQLPLEMKVRQGQGKWLLRHVLDRLVPRQLIDRPKMGLSVPIAHWLRGSLRPWAEDLLAPDRLRRQGILNAPPITAAWAALQRGQSDLALRIWAVLMFLAWHERWHG
jgi:asparagine synthase (glutamine-hydrolysing)